MLSVPRMFVCAAVSILVMAAGVVHAESMDIYEELLIKGRQTEGFQGRYTMVMHEGGDASSMTGTIAYLAPEFFRMEADVDGPESHHQITISDGKTVWQVMPKLQTAYRVDIGALSEEFGEDLMHQAVGGWQQSLALLEPETIKLLGNTQMSGVDTHIIEGELRPEIQSLEAMGDGSRAKLWIGVEDAIERKIEVTDGQGEPVYTLVLSDVSLELPDADQFAFTPSESMQVSDLTGPTREALRAQVDAQVDQQADASVSP